MQRIIRDKLIKWKNGKRRKPLILRGARQIGKTWSVERFGRENYADIAEVKNYFFVGGMPEAVKAYADSGSMLDAFEVQSKIVDASSHVFEITLYDMSFKNQHSLSDGLVF